MIDDNVPSDLTQQVNAKTANPTIIRVIHNRENPFVQLNKQALWNDKLSLKATGLWARCMSRPDNWQFKVCELAKNCKEGRRAIDSAIKELIDNRYALRLEGCNKDLHGKFNGFCVEYLFFEFPATDEEINSHRENFKKSFQHCCFSNCRDGNRRNSKLPIKNLKAYPKDKEKECVSAPDEQASTLTHFFFEKLKEMNPTIKQPNLRAWDTQIKQLLHNDGRSEAQVVEVINFIVQQHHNPTRDFTWSLAIRSPSSLRDKFDDITREMKRPSPPSKQKREEEAKKADNINANQDFARAVSDKFRNYLSDSIYYKVDATSVTFGNRERRTHYVLGFSEHSFKEQIKQFFRNNGIICE